MSNRNVSLEAQLEKYERELGSLNSYIKELTDKSTALGTDKQHFETDLFEAEQNVKYYEDEIERVKKEMGKSGKTTSKQTGTDTILPRTAKQGIGSLIFSSISFLAGALIGSKLKSKGNAKGAPEEKRDN